MDYFGAIAATVIVMALVADVILLPAALRILNQRARHRDPIT
jgi:predicted RND superfamily exporter protein